MVSVKCPAEDRREQGMESLDTIFELCKEAGVHEQAVIPVEKISFPMRSVISVRSITAEAMGKTWACPPGWAVWRNAGKNVWLLPRCIFLPHGIRWRIPWIWMGCGKGRRLTKRFVPECVKYLKRILPKRWY